MRNDGEARNMKHGGPAWILTALAAAFALVLILSAGAAAAGLVALTFDDGPGKPTERLLDGLRDRDVPATFFMLGSCAERYPSTVLRAYREGHQIANHSWNHANMIYNSWDDTAADFRSAAETLKACTWGGDGFLVRVPYGSYNDTVLSAVGAPVIGWSVDPKDWKYRDASTVRRNIVSSVFDGAIVLVHDIHPSSVEGALLAVDDLKAAGYEFVTVRELFRRRGVTLENGTVYHSAKPNGWDAGPLTPPVLTEESAGGSIRVTLCADPGVPVYYTTDGSSPAVFGGLYGGPFTVEPGTRIRAVAALHLNGSRSREMSRTLTVPPADMPRMTVEDGVLILTVPEGNPGLYYSLNKGPGTAYEGPVPLTPGTVLEAWCAGEGWLSSPVTAGWYSPRGNFFRDVAPGDWFAEPADAAAEEGWLIGTGNDCFSPSLPVTRGQTAAILYRMAGRPEEPGGEDGPVLSDAEPGQYYAAPAVWAVRSGIFDEPTDGRFRPGDPVTRQELALILHRFRRLTGSGTMEGEPLSFGDAEEIAPWAKEAVDDVSAAGILVGDPSGRFRPESRLTRAECAAVVIRMSRGPGH